MDLEGTVLDLGLVSWYVDGATCQHLGSQLCTGLQGLSLVSKDMWGTPELSSRARAPSLVNCQETVLLGAWPSTWWVVCVWRETGVEP